MCEEKDKPPPLETEQFERLWDEPSFKEVVRASATGSEPLRYRRMVMEGRVAAAQYDMVRWTKFAVLTAIGTSMLSVVVSTLVALAGNG